MLFAAHNRVESLNSPKKKNTVDAIKSGARKNSIVINERHAELPLDEQMSRRWQLNISNDTQEKWWKTTNRQTKKYTKDYAIEDDKPHLIEFKSELIVASNVVHRIKSLSSHAKISIVHTHSLAYFLLSAIVIIWFPISMNKVMKRQFSSILNLKRC